MATIKDLDQWIYLGLWNVLALLEYAKTDDILADQAREKLTKILMAKEA